MVTSFVSNPHAAVCGFPESDVLNLVYDQNQATRLASVELCQEKPEQVSKTYRSIISNYQSKQDYVRLNLFEEETNDDHGLNSSSANKNRRILTMPRHHPIPSAQYLDKTLYKLYDCPPESYQDLLKTPGVGPSTLRALSMVAEVTHGAAPTFQDPVRYTFTHGGKDRYPFPVQRTDLTNSLEVLRTAIAKAKLGEKDKFQALKKLAHSEDQLAEHPYDKQ